MTARIVEQNNRTAPIDGLKGGVLPEHEGVTRKLQQAVQTVAPGERTSVYQKVARYDAQAHRDSLLEMKNGYLTIKPTMTDARTELAQNDTQDGRFDPYDSVPNHGQRFKEDDGQEYYWNFANKGSTEEDYQRLKKQYGDDLVDHKIIQYRDPDGTPEEGMILKWRVPGAQVA